MELVEGSTYNSGTEKRQILLLVRRQDSLIYRDETGQRKETTVSEFLKWFAPKPEPKPEPVS